MSDESNDDEYSVEEDNIPTKNPLGILILHV